MVCLLFECTKLVEDLRMDKRIFSLNKNLISLQKQKKNHKLKRVVLGSMHA